jgi:hypothetical protein
MRQRKHGLDLRPLAGAQSCLPLSGVHELYRRFLKREKSTERPTVSSRLPIIEI